MSEIANALAKAKERTGQTSAPFMVPGAAPIAIDPARAAAAAAAIRKARRTQRFWFFLIAISLPATALLVWSRLRPDSDPKIDLPDAGSSTAITDSSPALTTTHSGAPNQDSSANPGTVQTHNPVAPTPAPRPDLMTRVTALSITAVMPGEPPRIVIAGRIIRQGQTLDADLTFSNVSDGQILFTDARGAIYSRRY